MKVTPDHYPIPQASVISHDVDNELLLVLPDMGQVKVLNPVGAQVWGLMDGSRNIRQISEILVKEYAIDSLQAQEDVLDFISSLVERGVCTLADHPKSLDNEV